MTNALFQSSLQMTFRQGLLGFKVVEIHRSPPCEDYIQLNDIIVTIDNERITEQRDLDFYVDEQIWQCEVYRLVN